MRWSVWTVWLAACVAGNINEDSGKAPLSEPTEDCTPGTSSCSADVLETCGPDGQLASSKVCALGCAGDGALAHCAHIVPAFLPTACDGAGEANVVLGTIEIDTDVDLNCSGGVLLPVDGPEVCLIRGVTLRVEGTPTVFRGSRAVALVADTDLTVVAGATIDGAAEGAQDGPGGGWMSSGTPGSADGDVVGGGGAGFATLGGNGGIGGTSDGAEGTGGAPIAVSTFMGGPGAGATDGYPQGGGGGGAIALLACEGTLTLDGTVSAGGGGGQAGFAVGAEDQGGAGGGAGGLVSLQAGAVTGTGFLYANGGGGGGGCKENGNCQPTRAEPGEDGTLSVSTSARGGQGYGGPGRGGDGGVSTLVPTPGSGGSGSGIAGGGGGSVGVVQIRTVPGTLPSLLPGGASPAVEVVDDLAVE